HSITEPSGHPATLLDCCSLKTPPFLLSSLRFQVRTDWPAARTYVAYGTATNRVRRAARRTAPSSPAASIRLSRYASHFAGDAFPLTRASASRRSSSSARRSSQGSLSQESGPAAPSPGFFSRAWSIHLPALSSHWPASSVSPKREQARARKSQTV